MAVGSFLKFLAKRDLIDKTIITAIERVKEKKKLPKIITIEDYDTVRACIDRSDIYGHRDYTIFTLFMSSGIRVGGLCNLTVNDIDLKNETIKIIGKGDKEYLTVFGSNCYAVLKHYLHSIRGHFPKAKELDALFISRNGKPISIRTVQSMIRNLKKKSGIEADLTCHTLRRTFCTELIRNEANLYHVADMMGHSSLEHLKRYTLLHTDTLAKTHKACHPRG